MQNIPLVETSSKTTHTAATQGHTDTTSCAASPATSPSDETDIYNDRRRLAHERWHCRDEINFINHVVLVWLHRVRRGDRTITIPDSVIKARGKETANIINCECKFYPTQWLRAFLKKLDQEDARGPKEYPNKHLSVYIADIVKEELPKFFGETQISSMKAYRITPSICKSVHGNRTEEKTVQTDKNIQRYDNPKLSQPNPNIINPGAEYTSFIFHVVLIWLHQARRGDSTISLPESAIRARVKEAADIIKKNHRFDSSYWMRLFKEKLNEEDAIGLGRYSRPYLAAEIKDIIKAEQSDFYKDASQNKAYDKEDAVMDALKTDDAIQSYDELLDCLKMIQNYALYVRNIDAVVLVTQIEEICMADVE